MVLESIISPQSAQKSPIKIVLLSFVFVTLSVWLSIFVAIQPVSMMMIVFTVLPSIPFILSLFNSEEEKMEQEKVFLSKTLARHLPVVIVLAAYFVGLIIGFTFWYLALPDATSGELFAAQLTELKSINAGVVVQTVANAIAPSGSLASVGNAFEYLFLHNLEVLLLIVAFSVLYGAGSVFILVWNSAIISVFIGNVAKQFVFHENPAFSLISGASVGALGLLPHGTFELFSYLAGALAGGILSRAVIRKTYQHAEFTTIVRDVLKLIAWAVVLLAIGALIESNSIVL